MRLDIRIPIGLLFSILGGILTLYGAFTDDALYQRSLGVNINFWWGLALLIFGGFMLALARRSARNSTRTT
ncbi:MAG: hypothetical protein IPI01_20110 [Ignavibacteriae bacterium]|nr:hypothetical protein [Ignavibacteriota bacterium]